MQKTFIVYADPGHAWGKVPQEILQALGLKAADFSSYSFLGSGCLFLEEDCDLNVFIEAYRDQTGIAPKWNDRRCNGESSIRRKPRNEPHNAQYYVPLIASGAAA